MDLQFTGAYRVPFQYSPYLRQHLQVASFVQGADGVTVTDLDGNQFSDLTGSYGVNVFGHDFDKRVMAEGAARARSHGVLLGSYHPAVAANLERLRAISGLDEVSFHMSGTEAVMQAVRLSHYRTRKTHLVRFCGAHHGWWEDVQPGPGNPVKPHDTSTLKEMDADTLRVLRTRKDIAWCGVPPPGTMQAAAWNSGAVLGGCFAASHTGCVAPCRAHRHGHPTVYSAATYPGSAIAADSAIAAGKLLTGGDLDLEPVRCDGNVHQRPSAGSVPASFYGGPCRV